MANKKLLESLPFSVEARIAIQLGRESISSSLVAIGELVKNAYDADAEELIIKLTRDNSGSLILIISDNGEGMDFATLKNSWMRIGTTNKYSAQKSGRKGRVYTGAKGLGRLGLDRLCSSLRLVTKKNDSSDLIFEVDIEWSGYEDSQGLGLDDVVHSIYQVDSIPAHDPAFPIVSQESGTRYILSGLKDSWSEEFLVELRKELSLLASPFAQGMGFRIKLQSDVKGLEVDEYITSAHFLAAAEWRMHAEIGSDDSVSIQIYDENDALSYAPGSVPWVEWIKLGADRPLCGPVKFDLYFMRRKRARSITSAAFKNKDIVNFLENNQGVRIYRDHFRVKPYGDPNGDGDWLKLAMRRTTNPESITMKDWKIGYNQCVGAVFISKADNQALIDQTNREGLTEVPAYFHLRAFALRSIEEFESHIQRQELKKKEEIIFDAQEIKSSNERYQEIIDEIKSIRDSSQDNQTKSKLEKLTKTFRSESKKTEQLYKHVTELQQEKNTLANLASIGIMTVAFGHETLGAISSAKANSVMLKGSIKNNTFMLPIEIEQEATRQLDSIQASVKYVSAFGSFALGNIRRDKRERRKIDLWKIADGVRNTLSELLSRQAIHIELIPDIHTPFFINAYEIDWESIYANLILNSCYALEKSKNPIRKIRMSFKLDGQAVIVIVDDSGCGLEKGIEKDIFNPTFTTRRNEKGDLTGTGMGLSIVKTFVEEHSSGHIDVVPSSLGGAAFMLSVPASPGT